MLSLSKQDQQKILQSIEVLEVNSYKDISLVEYFKAIWHILEPGTVYKHNWHIDAICEHLQATYNGSIRNLLINIPPRHAKSLLVSVAFPTWLWTKNPHFKFLYTSYGQQLSTRDSLKCRRIIQSKWYQQRYGHIYQLSKDQSNKTRFDNDKTGYRLSSSVRGLGTGEGGDFIVVDDPHNVSEGESDAVRESTLLWWDEVMSSRFNDPQTGRRIIVMQRVHERDLSGHVLEQGGYEHLMLPAEYERRTYVTSLGWKDPRKEDGELLWPDHFGHTELEELKKRLGIYGTASQLQQIPAPRGGGIIKIDNINRYEEKPEFSSIILSWDTAFKEKTSNDYSVCTMWGMHKGAIYLFDRFKGKLAYPDLKKKMVELAVFHSPIAILIEDKASGQSILQELERPIEYPEKSGKYIRLPVKGIRPDGDKESRVHAITVPLESMVYMPKKSPWIEDFLHNLAIFPKGAHDDDVDSMSQAIFWLSNNKRIFTSNLDYMSR